MKTHRKNPRSGHIQRWLQAPDAPLGLRDICVFAIVFWTTHISMRVPRGDDGFGRGVA